MAFRLSFSDSSGDDWHFKPEGSVKIPFRPIAEIFFGVAADGVVSVEKGIVDDSKKEDAVALQGM